MSVVNYKSDQVFLYWDDPIITNPKDRGDADTNSDEE
jgi:hypothetical protein